ncbi:acyl-CoA carboxylase epsilon subunit [Streptomyces sp. NPDC002328]|uniref:acyl-CoA carboxylase epsilon subunit n=1 Tax=Streptomyces sp. NPDC002328 TaxID=3364642 RepID=UPI003683E07F
MEHARALLRVERGQAREEELAALTAVLLALRSRAPAAEGTRPPAAAPRWWSRPDDYAAPGSWR